MIIVCMLLFMKKIFIVICLLIFSTSAYSKHKQEEQNFSGITYKAPGNENYQSLEKELVDNKLSKFVQNFQGFLKIFQDFPKLSRILPNFQRFFEKFSRILPNF